MTTLLFFAVPAKAATLVIPNADFEDQGDVLDGDGDGLPVAQDPGDRIIPVPGWHADERGGAVNLAGTVAPQFLTATAHSGRLAMLLHDDDPYAVPILTPAGAVLELSPGDTLTVRGWMADPTRAQETLVIGLGIFTPHPSPTFPGTHFADPQPGLDEAFAFDGAPPNSSDWVSFSVTLTIGQAASPWSGQPLALSFRSLEENPLLIDTLSLTIDRVPEPTSLVAAATAVMFLWRRKR